jgi:hypothetical protein
MYKVISVRPAVDFTRLEDVLIVKRPSDSGAAGGPS